MEILLLGVCIGFSIGLGVANILLILNSKGEPNEQSYFGPGNVDCQHRAQQ